MANTENIRTLKEQIRDLDDKIKELEDARSFTENLGKTLDNEIFKDLPGVENDKVDAAAKSAAEEAVKKAKEEFIGRRDSLYADKNDNSLLAVV